MATSERILEHPKKRRRRDNYKTAISARLILDDNLRGEAGVLSGNLVTDLLGQSQNIDALQEDPHDQTNYVAVQPWTPIAPLAEDLPWTIIPISPPQRSDISNSDSPSTTIRYPASSIGLGTFLKALEGLDPSHNLQQIQKPIDIRVQAVVPLLLDTIFVTVQKDLIKTIDDIQDRFGGGFAGSTANGTRKENSGKHDASRKGRSSARDDMPSAQERLQGAVRQGLSHPRVVHSGDIVALPLPSHPITHTPPPPAIVVECEPVNQGLLTAKTKIVVVQTQSSHERALKKLQPPAPAMKQVVEDEADDTSNEQFFSAAEDRESETSSEMDGASGTDSGLGDSANEESDAESDDSLDDIISLSAPGLPPQPSGTLSAMTAATPRPGSRRLNGTQTPGSVYSNYTATTARPGRSAGKVFKAEMLLKRIPAQSLFPRPADDEDEDSFLYVDIHVLAKIGCFSGDWVKIESCGNPANGPFSTLNFINPDDSNVSNFRVARVFGLPGLASDRPQYAVDKTGDRRTSFSQLSRPLSTANVYLSPLIFSSLGSSTHIRLSPMASNVNRLPKHLAQEAKASSLRSPSIATEIVLTKIQTPPSTERTLDQAIFTKLQKYFESKRRLLKSGDLIGLDIDEDLSRTMYSSAKSASTNSDADLADVLAKPLSQNKVKKALVWFRVDHISIESHNHKDGESDEDPWGGVALIDVASTTIRQAGTDTCSIPLSVARHWQYWFGIKRRPISNQGSKSSAILAASTPDEYISPLQTRLSSLVSAITSARALRYGQPPLVVLIHSTQRQTGKTYTAHQACAAAGVHVFPISAYDVLAEGSSTSGGGDVKTEGYLASRAERALQCGPEHTALLVQHIEQLTADRMLPALKDIIASSRVLIATTTEIEKIPDGIRGLFTHELELRAPNESEREGILRNAVSDLSLRISPVISLRSVALKTAALVAGDLIDVVYRAALARSERLSKLIDAQNIVNTSSNPIDLSSVLVSGGPYTTHILNSDFDAAITAARAAFSASISAPRIPSVTWEDVGGLANAKDAIKETIELPLQHPSLFAKGLRKRSGILFYGPPGTGKTLLAKAIATEYSLNFFSVKGPELLNMYIGESEANVRRVFQRARDARPCVVFFDELDSVAPKRGNQGDSGGVMDRIVSQLLAELDGMSSDTSSDGKQAEGKDSSSTGGGAGVFVIGATNRPDLLDPALLRPGRFDKMIYLGIPDTHEKQLYILQALTRKFAFAHGVDLHRVADRLPLTYTGADLYALASDAMLKAVTRRADETDVKVKDINEERKSRGLEEISTAWYFDHVATGEDIKVFVNEKDFDDAAKDLVGSVSEKEMKHFERIRQTFEEGEPNDSNISQSTDDLDTRVQALLNAAASRPQPQQQSTLPLRPRPSAPSKTEVLPQRYFTTTHPPPPQQPIRIPSSSAAAAKGKSKSQSKPTNPIFGNPDSGPETDDEDSGPPLIVNGDHDEPAADENGYVDEDEDEDEYIIDTSNLQR